MTVSHQDVIDATAFVESHHFRGTTVVAVCLTLKDKRTVLGIASSPIGAPFDIAEVAGAARASADAQVAKELEQMPLQAESAG